MFIIRKDTLRKLLLLTTMVMTSALLYPQESFFTNLSMEDGLPSNEVYDILACSQGYLWFATDNGVSRYDGSNFKNFSTDEGLAASSVLKLYEDRLGRIWFLAYNGMLSYYDDGTVRPFPYNDTLLKYYPDNYFDKIYLDSAGRILLAPRKGGMGIIDPGGALTENKSLLTHRCDDSSYLYFRRYGDDYFISIFGTAPEECKKKNKVHCGDEYYLKTAFINKEFQRHFLHIDEHRFLLSYRNTIYGIEDNKLVNVKAFDEEVLSLYLDNTGRVWVSVKYDHGVYRYNDASLAGIPAHFLDGNTITSVIQDREGYYWFSSEGNGLFYAESFEFSLYSVPGLNRAINVLTLEVHGDRLWFTTREKEVYSGRLANGRLTDIRQLNIEDPFNWINHLVVDAEGYIWLSSSKSLRYDPAGFAVPPDSVENFTYIGRGNGDTIIVANTRLGFYYRNKLINLDPPPIERRFYSAVQMDDDIWLGTLYGLYVYRNNEYIDIGALVPTLSNRINCISRAGDMLVVGTADNGLAFIRNDSLVDVLTSMEGLRTNSITALCNDGDSLLWAGSKNGLHKISLGGGPGFRVLESYGPGDGLPSREINGIRMHDGHVWLATSSGLVSFLPSEVRSYKVPPLVIMSGIQINGEDTAILDNYVLAHNQNNIHLTFQPVSYRKGGPLFYRYRVEGLSDDYIYTSDNVVDLLNLSPGKYRFSLAISNVHGIWNPSRQAIVFEIRKHYTQTTAFMVFLILAALSIIIALLLFLQQQRRLKAEGKIELARMEQRIFRLQMNPHFVFNALLAIQGFMYQRNVHDAGRYLTSFAKLIRHTLYGSSEELMSLDKEIEAMKYYLDLQRLRFNENFEYTIEIGDGIFPESLKIPPMLIQPFLENAIEHGLQHKTVGKGELSLKFCREQSSIVIEIADNGIGREKSSKKNRNKGRLHKSMGMTIVNKRIASLNKLLNTNIRLEITDLDMRSHGTSGTRIRIFIPD